MEKSPSPNTSDSHFSFTINSDDDFNGHRIDFCLAKKFSGQFSRSRIKQLIQSGNILVNDVLVKPNYHLKQSDLVKIDVPDATPSHMKPWDFPLDIYYEDEYLLILNKPAGISVHPASSHSELTLVHALINHCKNLSGIGGVERPGIVHRLDKKTSGLLMVAKTDIVHRELSKQLQERSILREYYTVILGCPAELSGIIDLPIGRHPAQRKKMSVHSYKSRQAITKYKILEKFKEISLVSVHLLTGRTHQIRVHFSSIHHPVIGDDMYSPRSVYQIKDLKLQKLIKGLSAYALHARTVGFQHPIKNIFLTFTSPLPDYFENILNYVRE
ncbi:MAG: hypothetical protein A2161_02135 [Candidatus Schekmanbacteria bacterium RBG_13_48_7]|uniref:Pseudouridine synthase n=1 Tax=Candidatus Schekmanbacteria bacterium RBG_13_48_7 TaxID=1817878 RepID=A0A1F7RTC3_9BACT|nr:MAG: hypothetical protein A2161_02135 [Candidatus Schekmanbacteria bacterium RBG_13_48_7]